MKGTRTDIIGAFHAATSESPFKTKHISQAELEQKDLKRDISLTKPISIQQTLSEQSPNGQQQVNDDDKMYMNITSSPRKRPILSAKKNDYKEDKESLSKMIENGNNLLKSIISALSENGTYEMSDWEDEEPMKMEDIDQECETFDGKKIPSWALVEPLKKSIHFQKQTDGDKIFANLPRRCNLEAVFGTKSIPYYVNKKKTIK